MDVIISVGYRVKSKVGTRFRQWANAVLKDYLLRGYAVHQQAMALQQINLRIDAQNDRIARIEDALDQQQQQLDFVVRVNEKPEELLIPTGCVWDAYMFVCDLIRSAEKRIILVDNFVNIGIVFLIIAFCIVMYVIYGLTLGKTVPGWASLILSVWLVGGFVMTSLGIIGTYIGKIFTEVKHRPLYHITDILE